MADVALAKSLSVKCVDARSKWPSDRPGNNNNNNKIAIASASAAEQNIYNLVFDCCRSRKRSENFSTCQSGACWFINNNNLIKKNTTLSARRHLCQCNRRAHIHVPRAVARRHYSNESAFLCSFVHLFRCNVHMKNGRRRSGLRLKSNTNDNDI